MKRTKAEANQTRQCLLDAALEVFLRTGVTRASLQGIAQEAGVTRGALYWHFKNKDDLFEALYAQNYECFLAMLGNRALEGTADTFKQLQYAIEKLFTILSEDERQRKFCIVMFLKCEQTDSNVIINELARRYRFITYNQFHRALTLCQAQGSLSQHLDIDLATHYLDCIVGGIILNWVKDPDCFSLTKHGILIFQAALSALQQNTLSITK